MTDSAAPAAWYDDPEDPTQYRYWDGTAWTEHRAPKGTTTPRSTASVLFILAGIGFILAGLMWGVSLFVSNDVLQTALRVLETIGLVGAFVCFLVARYPSRDIVARVLTITIISAYGLVLLLGPVADLSGRYGLWGTLNTTLNTLWTIALGLGFAFGLLALVADGFDRRIGFTVFGLYAAVLALTVLQDLVYSSDLPGGFGTAFDVLSVLAFIAAGVLVLVFALAPRNAAAASSPAPAA